MREALNLNLDRLIRTGVHILDKCWSAYHVCGCTGFALAVLLSIVLMVNQGLSLWVLAGMTLTTALTFFGLAMATKIVAGEEQLIYYHHEIAIMAAVALLVWLLRQPVLPYIDVTILGLGTFLVCGRLGCLMVGCCHGRPHRWGICYRQEHADAGFPQYYVGVRLFPIQAVESLLVFSVVAVGTVLVLTGHPPGEALAWYVVTYGMARFFFEFVRGDVGRPDFFGFSEAQWTSLLLMGAGVWAEMAGILSLHPWHGAATACLGLSMIAVTAKRHFQSMAKHQLLHPRHIKEVAEAVDLVSNLATERAAIPKQNSPSTVIDIGCTSLGIQISTSKINAAGGDIDHYALSSQDTVMTQEIASTLAEVILQLKHISAPYTLIPGSRGVFHVVVYREEDSSHFPLRVQPMLVQLQ